MNEWMKAINVCIHNQYVLVCWRWAPSLDGFTLLIKRRGPHVNWTGKHPLYRYCIQNGFFFEKPIPKPTKLRRPRMEKGVCELAAELFSTGICGSFAAPGRRDGVTATRSFA